MILDVHKGVEDVDKPKEEEEETDLEEKEKATSTNQLVNRMKQTNWLVILILVIWNPGLINQKLNVIIVKQRSLH